MRDAAFKKKRDLLSMRQMWQMWQMWQIEKGA